MLGVGINRGGDNSSVASIALKYNGFTSKTIASPSAPAGTYDYTLTGTGDVTTMETAAGLAKVLRLSRGTFIIDSTFTLGNNIILGQGSSETTLIITTTVSEPITIEGTRTQYGGAGVVSSASGSTINVTSNLTASISPGDILHIDLGGSSSDPALVFSGKRSYYTKGEYVTVDTINATTITTVAPLRYTYPSNSVSRLYKYAMRDTVGIEGVTIVFDNGTIRNNLAILRYCKNSFAKDVIVIGNDYQDLGLSFESSKDCVIDNCRAYRVADIGTGSGRTGFGISMKGCENFTVTNCYCGNNRHSIDIDKNDVNPAVSYNILIKNGYFSGDVVSVSSHGGADTVVWDGLTINSPSQRWLGARATNQTIKNCKFTGSNSVSGQTVISIGEDAQSGGAWYPDTNSGIAGTNLIIENNTVNISGSNLPFILGSDPFILATIRNNHMYGADREFILVYGNGAQSLTIQDNYVEFNNQDAGYECISFEPGYSTSTYSGTVTRTRFIDADNSAGTCYKDDANSSGSLTETNVTYV